MSPDPASTSSSSAASTPSSPSTPSPPASSGKPAAPGAKPKSAPTPTKPSTPAAAPAKPAVPAAKPAEKKEAPKEKPAPAPAKARKWEETKERAARPTGPPPKVVDASGLVLGRAASLLAKRLLKGETIVVVNTEKAVVVGGYSNVLELYRTAVARGSVRKGPHYPRRPDRIFRRTVRGMLPFRHSKGREAWSRILTYVGVPEEFKALPRETLETAKARPSLRPPLTLGEISRHVGGIGPW